jgi:hypothetical protein
MILRHPFAMAACATLAAALPAQLAGTYAIGPSGNFANLAAAITALNSQGVVAPVTFVLLANETGPWTINAFAGQGTANPVVFDGLGTATIAGGQPVLTLNGCANVTFRGLSGSFTNTPNTFVIQPGTADTTFTNCRLLATVATTGQALFTVNGGSGLTIEDCEFGGSYESIYVLAAASNTTLRRNKILGGGFWIMRLAGSDILLENNFITGTSQYGISAGVSGNTASAQNLKIRHNSIYINHPTTSAQFCSLRWYAAAANNTEVVDNIFYDGYGATAALNMWCSGALRPTVMDYNCLWSNVAGYNCVFAGVNLAFSAWQALGFDANSIQADPLYTAPGTTTAADLRLGSGSPCATAGTLLPGTPFDYFWYPRTTPVSIGAHESDGSQASYTVFAAGCAGTAGTPSNSASQPPQLGTSSTITFGNLPNPPLAIAIVGFSNTLSGFGPLPLHLAGFGAPNCYARVSADATSFLLGNAGAASFTLSTPNLPGLIGLTYHTQGLVLDPANNALGVSMSAAATAIVGL